MLWNLTGGETFACDHSNASRTQLFDTSTLTFSADLAAVFNVTLDCLPAPLPSDSRFGQTAAGRTALPKGIPIHAMMGDSHAALYGHGVRAAGVVKATYGTGSSLMTITPSRISSRHGLSGTIAWTDHNGTTYALEGNITVSAQAAAFMAEIMGIEGAANLSKLAQTVADSAGVVFIPALAGLGAPHWNDTATGTVSGMTHGTTRGHLARATFEAIALQICDVFTAMQQDIGHPLVSIRADGGASGNGFLMQMQADLLGQRVSTSEIEEVGAIGVAAMAFAALGQPLMLPDSAKHYDPTMPTNAAMAIKATWAQALQRFLA
ncbi:MAG: FGGY-family carbohydrate kinase [Cypionkella sp.]|nr:FGGY-family carbohydrate kinase [Cypionkella sp.]